MWIYPVWILLFLNILYLLPFQEELKIFGKLVMFSKYLLYSSLSLVLKVMFVVLDLAVWLALDNGLWKTWTVSISNIRNHPIYVTFIEIKTKIPPLCSLYLEIMITTVASSAWFCGTESSEHSHSSPRLTCHEWGWNLCYCLLLVIWSHCLVWTENCSIYIQKVVGMSFR